MQRTKYNDMEAVEIGDIALVGELFRDVTAVFSRYTDNGNIAIVLMLPDGERLATATVNVGVPGVFIKDYAENEGMLEQLVAKGLVQEIGAYVQSGFVSVPEVKLLGMFAEAASPWSGPAA